MSLMLIFQKLGLPRRNAVTRDLMAKVLKDAEKEWDRLKAEGDDEVLPPSVWHLMADRLLERMGYSE